MKDLLERAADFPKVIVEGDLDLNDPSLQSFQSLLDNKSPKCMNEVKSDFVKKSEDVKEKGISLSSVMDSRTLSERILEVDCLSAEEQQAFVNWFTRFKFKKGMAVYNLFKISKRLHKRELEQKVYKALANAGIVEEQTYLICPNCREKELAKSISAEKLEQVKAYLDGSQVDEEVEDFVDILECEDCGYEKLTSSNLVEKSVFKYCL